jgi:UTP:GlnB (protein PII) uridylyltransferase
VKENVITIETEEEDGNTTVEHIDCWSEERSRKANTAAVLQDQLVDIQKASTWAQQETNTVSTVQADDIAQQEEHLQTQVREVEQLMSKQVNTTCRSTEDIVTPAGHKLMRAVTATVAELASNLHCTMMFEVTGTKQTAQIDPNEFD